MAPFLKSAHIWRGIVDDLLDEDYKLNWKLYMYTRDKAGAYRGYAKLQKIKRAHNNTHVRLISAFADLK